MKTTGLILSLLFTVGTFTATADNDRASTPSGPSTGILVLAPASLVPAVPEEADFEEIDYSCSIPLPASIYRKVVPKLPRNADFDDDMLPVHIGKLIPVNHP